MIKHTKMKDDKLKEKLLKEYNDNKELYLTDIDARKDWLSRIIKKYLKDVK